MPASPTTHKVASPRGVRWLAAFVVASILGIAAGVVGAAAAGAVSSAEPAGSFFHPVTPQRLLDTRYPDIHHPAELGPGQTIFLGLALPGADGQPPIDANRAVAVSLNVTVTEPTAAGYLSLFPDSAPQPLASNLNFLPGQTIPNAVIVGLGRHQGVQIFNSAGWTNVIVDVTGWFEAGFHPVNPVRVMDTRAGQGGSTLQADETRTLQVVGANGLPAAGPTAFAVNVTVTNTSAPGYVTVFPGNGTRPVASSVNFNAGETRPNLVTVGVDAAGRISIYNYGGTADVIVDVFGWYADGFSPVAPYRAMDTRQHQGGIALAPGEARNLQVTGAGGVPVTGVGAVALNVTATNANAPGYLTVYPSGQPAPTASNVNYLGGQSVSNAVIVGVGAGGQITIYNYGSTADVVIDVGGWFGLGQDGTQPAPDGPRLVALDFPTTVDTSQGSVAVPVTLHVVASQADLGNRSGMVGWVSFQSSLQPAMNSISPGDLVSGGPRDATYKTMVTFPAHLSPGFYPIAVGLYDAAGATSTYHTNVLTSFGFPTGVQQVGNRPDNTGPNLTGLTISPSTIDTSAGPVNLDVTVTAHDDLSGFEGAGFVDFHSVDSAGGDATGASSGAGSATDTFTFSVYVPQYSRSGQWAIDRLVLRDVDENTTTYTAADIAALGLPTTFTNSGQQDVTGPQLVDFSFAPGHVNTSAGPQTVTFTAHIVDNQSGFSYSDIAFVEPMPSNGLPPDMIRATPPTLVSGTPQDGLYQTTAILPAGATTGTWQAAVLLVDHLGNDTQYQTADLAAHGWPSALVNE
jgi:hypothetical protein